MSINVQLFIPQNIKAADKKAKRIVKECITDYTDDLYRVATLRTPVDQGNLETSGTKKVSGSGDVVGEVSFAANNRNTGFNYAKYMHDGKYKLGAQSKAKSSRGARSKYANRSFKVGSKYLEGTAQACEKGYQKDIAEKLGEIY